MTSQELMNIFTHPLGIQQDYRTRQLAIENILYQLYEAAGLSYPKVYSFKSPFALQLALNYIAEPTIKLHSNPTFYDEYPGFGREVELLSKPPADINDFFWKFIHKKVIKKIPEELKQPAVSIKRFAPYSRFCDTMSDHISDSLTRSLGANNLQLFPFAHHPHFRDIAWVNLYSQHLDKIPSEARSLFMLFHNLIKNGLMYACLYEDMVLWCPLPAVMELNEYKQLHAENGPALRWDDDFGVYLWKGIKVKKRLIEFPESIGRLDLLSEEDVDVRRCIREKLGAKKFASLFELIELDADLDANGHRNVLYRTTHSDDLTGKPYYFARLYSNNGIEERFVEVPLSTHNVWQAMALVFGNSNEETSRGVKV